MAGCRFAYYLVHSMGSSGDAFVDHDRRMASRFADAAARAGVERIIYLGGLGEMGSGLSPHLESRLEVESELQKGSVPVTALRAAMIIGSGSASFEILRYLVERLPAMITPRWVRTESQPIAIRNVLHYLVACLSEPRTTGRSLDIGGPEVVTYHRLMRIMAEERGLGKRIVAPVPVLTPRLSSYWIQVVTPVSFGIARPLAEGLRNRVVCRDDAASRLMPQPLLDCREAIRRALGVVSERQVETSWSEAGVVPGDPDWAGGALLEDVRSIDIDAPCSAVYRAICRLGGGHGWPGVNWLWQVRGAMDMLVGGPGLRRRRHPDEVGYGEALDFWRVIGLERNRRLTLLAEMKVPGEAVLEFRIRPAEEVEDDDVPAGGCRLEQHARFRPKGLFGLAYWYAVLPLHFIVFPAMLHGIRATARDLARNPNPA